MRPPYINNSARTWSVNKNYGLQCSGGKGKVTLGQLKKEDLSDSAYLSINVCMSACTPTQRALVLFGVVSGGGICHYVCHSL